MKCFGKRALCTLLTVCLLSTLLCAFASADSRSSAYLSSYSARLKALSGGEIAVVVDMDGAGTMDEIGATEIHIYESTDNVSFDLVESYYSDDHPEMLWEDDTYYYDDPVIYEGIVGRYYKATVCFYAAKNNGSDTAWYTTLSKRAVN